MGYMIILRHGPTKNDEISLNKKIFKKAAPKISKKILSYGKIDKIYISPLKRCRQTIRILRKYLKIDNAMIEEKEQLIRWNSGSEIHDMVTYRVDKFINSLKKKDKDKNVLIITHSSIIMPLLELIADIDTTDLHIEDISLTIYDTNLESFYEFNSECN
jgi:broad specificity phosphatase PhoE